MATVTETDDDSRIGTLTTRAHQILYPKTEVHRERRRIFILCLPYFILATFAAFIPVVVMARMSVSEERLYNEGFTLEAWQTLFTDPLYLQVAWNTLWFAAVATIFSVVIGVAVSHALQKYEFPAKRAVVAMISFPIALPGIVVAFMIIILLGRQGVLTNTAAFFTGQNPIDLATARTVFGLFLGYVFSLIPRSTMVLRGTFSEINTDAEEAARSLGASPLYTFYHVTLPQVWPGVVAAVILTFRSALAIFGTVLVIQALLVATLQISLEIDIGFNSQMAGAIGLVYFVFLISFTYVGLQFIEGKEVRL